MIPDEVNMIFSRKIKIANLVLLIKILMICTVAAQNEKIDSLLMVSETVKDEFQQAKVFLEISKLYETIDFQKGKEFAKKALYSENDSIMAEACNQLGRFFFFTSQLDSAKFYFEEAKKHLVKLDDERSVAIINISLGAVELRAGDYNQTIKTLTESLSYFEDNDDELNAAKCYSNISAAFAELGNYPKAIEYNEKALDVFVRQNLIQFQLITLPNLAAQHLKNGDTLKAINNNMEAEKLALAMKNKRSLSIIYNNLGSAYLDLDETKARQYLEKAIALKNELNLKSGIEVAQGNLGYLHLKNKEYKTALDYYQLVEKQVNGEQLVYAYEQIRKCYEGLKEYHKALLYSEKARQLNDSILDAENQKVFSEIQTRYETEKKEKEILELQSQNLEVDNKRIQNQNLFLIALGILFMSSILTYYIFKRNRQRQKAELEKLLKQLKDQELKGLDAIVEAQEKERERIANDLHDNLGSRMATLKLLIDDIHHKTKKEQTEQLPKLQLLADETYHEVRKIAHNSHTGSLISHGLIASMKTIADQISESGGLKVNVNNINVKQRVKNNIEILVFRIIQELLTNILKHAKASEATIQFSEDNQELTIMIEDNGKGFLLKETNLGFGLTNIEKRLSNLNGNIEIDSSPGNGTTIILTIPI